MGVTILGAWLSGTWNVLLVAAPFLLLGMLCAGLLHVLLARRHVERWLGQEGLLGVVAAACLGIPLPLCSCGVVPVAMALRRKGASRPASLSFLVTTPESGVDSILLTWGMLGPVMAVARPLASFVTALLAGSAAIALPDPDDCAGAGAALPPEDLSTDDAHVIGPREFWRSLRAYLRVKRRPPTPAGEPPPAAAAPAFEDVMYDVARYAFVELADDIAFWLVLGLFLAGAIGAVVPDDLAARGLGSGLTPMLLLLLAGVPLYMCASASTPVAAALVAKGISPGAALVFLLSGPATNAASIVLLARHFGVRFVRIYLASIVVATLLCGVALDWLIGIAGWRVQATLSGGLGGVAMIQWLSALALALLLGWRLAAGAGRQGVRELVENLQSLGGLAVAADASARRRFWINAGRRLARLAIAALVLAYVLAGVRVIPPDGRGYGFLFGRLVWPDLPPGLHYVPPAPFGRCDLWRVGYPRLTGVGFQPAVDAVANRRRLTDMASGNLWHSPVTAANTDPRAAIYLTGDENLLEVSFAVQYGLSDPRAFFYRVDTEGNAVRLYAEATAREYVAQHTLDELLTDGRGRFEAEVAEALQKRLDALGVGVAVARVLVVDIHPPQGAVDAFRDVASAREERETAINLASAAHAKEVPLARGHAAVDLATARATAATAETVARGQAEGLRAQAGAFASAPEVLGNLLWLETAERVLAGRAKLIVPPGSAGQNLVVWKDAPVQSSGAAGSPAARRLPPVPPAAGAPGPSDGGQNP
jgi:hypothetical protein